MALSNTSSLTTKFNTDPYYDDFDESKNFHRILFRPGLAVQARELTQLQSILQNQIDRLGEHIFKEGSLVRGAEINYDQNYAYVKLRNNTSTGSNANAASFIGKTFTGALSGVTAIVLNANDGAEANTPHLKTLFVKYTGSGSAGVTKMFTIGEKITATSGDYTANVAGAGAIGFGSAVSCGEGIIFAKDHFIRISPQTLILDKYSANTTYRVGFTVNELIIDSTQNNTLLDPASGSYNFAAPGARRLKLDVVLAKQLSTDLNTNNFIEILQTKNGLLQSLSDKTDYSIIKDYLAQRTYDTQGDMIVSGMGVRLREHLLSGNNNGLLTSGEGGLSTKLSADVAAGKSYVRGYDVEHFVSAHVTVDKGTDIAFIDTAAIIANFGNTIDVDNVVGQWDVNAQTQVSLRNQQANAAGNKVFSGGTSPATQIGTARVRALEYVSGIPGSAEAKYRLYLHDARMTGSKSFANVQCITWSAGAGNANGKADVSGSTGLNAAISTPSLNRAVFLIPAENIKRLRDTVGAIDNNFKFTKAFDGSFDVNGQFTINTGDASETFSGSGSLGATLARSRFYAVLRASGNTVALATTVNTNSTNTVTCSAAVQTQLNVGDVVRISGETASTFLTVSQVLLGSFKTLTAATSTGNNKSIRKQFFTGQVLDLGGKGKDGTRDVNVTGTTTCLVDLNETLNSPSSLNATIIAQLNKVDGQEVSKTVNRTRLVHLRLSDNAETTVGPWILGLSDGFKLISVRKNGSAFVAVGDGTDVTSNFTLDSGMRDNAYEHARLVKKSGSSLSLISTDFLLVTLDLFVHSYSSGRGYMSVDSYPVNDATAGSDTTKIFTYEIPLYISPLDGQTFDLRDTIDIRPRMTDTAVNTTTIGTVSTNPVLSTAYDQPSGGLHFAWPNTDFNYDLEYYLPRKDVLSQNKAGQFTVTKGVPSLRPDVPAGPADSMELATLLIAPYPSLPPEVAKQNNRPDLSCEIIIKKHPCLTMKDMGSIRSRVENLEYFLSLSMLEKEAQQVLIADTTGVDRFKNGILVDSFVGHNIGNVFDEEYRIAIDTYNGEIRPPCKVDSTELFYAVANSSNLVRTNTTTAGIARDQFVFIANTKAAFANGENVTCGSASGYLRYKIDNRLVIENATGTFTVGPACVGGTSGASSIASSVAVSTPVGPLLTLPYQHSILVKQKFATSTRNPVGVPYTWRGTLTMYPDTDYWMDTASRPEVQANFDSISDNWLYMPAAWTSIWKNWQTYWTGQSDRVDSQTFGRNLDKTTLESAAKRTWGEIRPVTSPESVNQKYSVARVVDKNIQPIMRGKMVRFTATGLKPSTRFYAFFDGENVSTYITPATSIHVASTLEGNAFISDSAGTLYGLFRISMGAQLRFRTGRKIFRLTDSSTNSSLLGTVTSAAETVFSAIGISSYADASIVSTRPYQLSGSSVMPSQTLQNIRPLTDTGQEQSLAGSDPLAQSFTVSGFQTEKIVGGGVYATKLDLYFADKDSTASVTVELREMDPVTKFMSPKVLPFSTVTVPSSSVYTKTKTTYHTVDVYNEEWDRWDPVTTTIITKIPVPTTIYFSAPVFLVNGKDYAIVVRPAGNNPNYQLFVARQGQNDINTGCRISAQPATGMLYVPSNDRTYTAVKEEDLSFVLYAATFDTAVTGSGVVKNAPKDTWTVLSPSSPFIRVGEVVHGETTFVLASSLTINTAITAKGNTSLSNGVITFTSATNMRVKGVPLANKFSNGETIHFLHANGLPIKSSGVYVTRRLTSVITPTAKVETYDTVSTSNNLLMVANVSYSNVGPLSAGGAVFVPGFQVKGQTDGYTTTIGTIKNLQGDSTQLLADYLQPSNTALVVSVKLSTGPTTKDTAATQIAFNEPTEWATTKYILSRSNEANTSASSATMVTAKSAEAILTFTTNSRHGSPAVDLNRLALLTIENRINSNAALGTSEDAVTAGGNAFARYTTRVVTLADGQDAEDIRVYITAYKRAGAGIHIYYKILNREDSNTFDQRTWIPMQQLTATTVLADKTNQDVCKEYTYGIQNYTNVYKAGANTTNTNIIEYRNTLGARYIGFKYFAVKVVLTDTETIAPPRVQNIRIIALQI